MKPMRLVLALPLALALVGCDGTQVPVDWARGEFEYLCDAMWAPRERPTLVVQTRDQRTLAVLDVDPSRDSARGTRATSG